MARSYARDDAQLSRLGVLVAQLESIAASASHKPPDPLMSFDLLSDLICAIDEEPKESVLLCQRKCEDALYSLLVLGSRRPVRHLASMAMAKIILKGDPISIYSRASSLQGFLSDGKKSDSHKVAGAAQCLGELYHYFGRRILSGILETINIVTKLLKFGEDFVREEALQLLRNALEGSGGNAASAAYIEAFRIITKTGIGDKSFTVRIAAARCLRTFANIGGPAIGIGELENALSYCVKALEDPVKSVRDAFGEALGALLALAMNPDAQVIPRGKVPALPKRVEGGLQKYFIIPFSKASGLRLKDVRIGISLAWVYFLQATSLKYLHPDSELQRYAVQVMDMLQSETTDAQALACVLYILRVGITDQMTEPTQRGFSVFLAKQLQSSGSSPSMQVASLRTLSYVLKTLGEVPLEFKEVLDDTVVAAVSHRSPLVRVEAALTLRALAEVDPSCVGGVISYAVTVLNAAREMLSFEKGSNFEGELDTLHGQAAVLASLVSISRKLPLGYPARLPKQVLEVCKNLLMKSSRNPAVATVEKEAGWSLLSSLLSSVPKEELQDQVFDILALWAPTFSGNIKQYTNQMQELTSEIRVWSDAMDALTSFVKCFVSHDSQNRRILLQPVLLYLNRALSYIPQISGKEQTGGKSSVDLFIVRLLTTYQALGDPSLYKSDHTHINQLCTVPFREPAKCDESSCLRMLLDRRDSWLGPWTPGRDWFEDELRYFQGGKDGVLTCVWETEPPSFPQPDTISKMLVNEILLCFGTMFAFQDSSGMLSFLSMIDQCLKVGKRQAWRASSITNICVGLLAALKALLAQRPVPLEIEIITAAQAIFQSVLAEGDICASQRRASAEGLGLLARLGNDIYTARLTKQLIGEATGSIDSNYAGSVAFSLGCIHRSAGGIALSSLVPTTVNVLSSLAKSSIVSSQMWSLHGLLLTIEAAGLSYVSQVQATLSLVMDILLSEESGLLELQPAIGRLINAIVAVIGPDLAPGSIFFSRCKSVVTEIGSWRETAADLENVCFTQQLVLFAPRAVPVHAHVLTLLPTLSSRQPPLRHLALSTLRHLIEKDPVSIIDEEIEETLFYMLDEETDPEIGSLARTTIMRLLYSSCPSRPSRWLAICHNMILSTSSRYNVDNNKTSVNDSSSGVNRDKGLNFGEDDESMVSNSRDPQDPGYKLDYSSPNLTRDRHLRYRTRVFAAECLNHIPEAVGENPAHFDLSLARAQISKGFPSGNWLVLQIQELISLAYQISTIQFEKMRPIGVSLLCTIMDKFAAIPDPEFPDHLLLEQYQAQLVSAVRSALDSLSDPILLEAGLQLATKMLTSGIISRDQAAVKRIFSLISRPLDDFSGLYYPSYAEWVSCKIKVRLLTVHASLKCYMFAILGRQGDEIPDEYLALLPLFSKSSSILGAYWLLFLKDYSFIRFHLRAENWKPFLDGIQSSAVLAELQPCLEEAWPVIVQALALDAVPTVSNVDESSSTMKSKNSPSSGYSMVGLSLEDFQFLWSLVLLILFQEQDNSLSEHMTPSFSISFMFGSNVLSDDSCSKSIKLYSIFGPVIQFLCTERFVSTGFLTTDACKELLQVFSYLIFKEDTWGLLAISFLSKVLNNCPEDFFREENAATLATELCLTSIYKNLLRGKVSSQSPTGLGKNGLVAFDTSLKLLGLLKTHMQVKVLVPFLLIGYKCLGESSTEICLTQINDFVQSIVSLLQKHGLLVLEDDVFVNFVSSTRACLSATIHLIGDCVQGIHQLGSNRSNLRKLLLMKLAYSLEKIFSISTVAFALKSGEEGKENNPLLFRLLHQSFECVRDVLTNSDQQIEAVGLQVVKVMLQKASGDAKLSSFLIFFVGELIEDFFVIISNILERTINREAVAIAGECLKILMLLQTLSKESDYQKGMINLLLEAILIILSPSNRPLSQDAKDLQIMAVKLVSQLAQLPTSATYIKDILLAMPAATRQQLQEIIRASVKQEQNPKQVPSAGPPLVIKLPSQTVVTDITRPLETQEQADFDESFEDEEDDDWDTFQSFPASANETSAAPQESVSTNNNGDFDSPSRTKNVVDDDVDDHDDYLMFQENSGSDEISSGHKYDEMASGSNNDDDVSPSSRSGALLVSEGRIEVASTSDNDQVLENMEDVHSMDKYDDPSHFHYTDVSQENEHHQPKSPFEHVEPSEDTSDITGPISLSEEKEGRTTEMVSTSVMDQLLSNIQDVDTTSPSHTRTSQELLDSRANVKEDGAGVIDGSTVSEENELERTDMVTSSNDDQLLFDMEGINTTKVDCNIPSDEPLHEKEHALHDEQSTGSADTRIKDEVESPDGLLRNDSEEQHYEEASNASPQTSLSKSDHH